VAGDGNGWVDGGSEKFVCTTVCCIIFCLHSVGAGELHGGYGLSMMTSPFSILALLDTINMYVLGGFFLDGLMAFAS